MNKKLSAICKPLYKLGVPYFTYFKLFKNGTYLEINARTDFDKFCLKELTDSKVYFNELMSILQLNKFTYHIMSHDMKLYKRNSQVDKRVVFLNDLNKLNVLSLFKSKGEFIECYAFAMPRNGTNSFEFYFNNLPLLEHFIEYFNENAQAIIQTSEIKKLALFQHQYNFSTFSQATLHSLGVNLFLQETKLNKLVKLSSREVECLKLLALGNKIKQIASSLELSPRTVEFYLRNARKKTGFFSTSELLVHFVARSHPESLQHSTRLNPIIA